MSISIDFFNLIQNLFFFILLVFFIVLLFFFGGGGFPRESISSTCTVYIHAGILSMHQFLFLMSSVNYLAIVTSRQTIYTVHVYKYKWIFLHLKNLLTVTKI